MNILISNNWLRDYLKTDASPAVLAEKLSLTSVSVEKIVEQNADKIYDIEVTTNRPDLMSVIGIAREAATILPHFDIKTSFSEPQFKKVTSEQKLELKIENDPKLVNRICAVALEINLAPSPEKIKSRVESSDIRSINNAVDVTNYVMREVGHPMHVFDYDKLMQTGRMIIRESKKGETIQTLDDKEYILAGGDIVADDGTGKIIDLLGVMGTLNSAVDETTKRVLLFVDNNNKHKIRKTSMNLGIRTEAAILNEKGVDPELADKAVLRGVELLKEIADGKVISEFVDIYPNKVKPMSVSVDFNKIDSVIGVPIEHKVSVQILRGLGFEVTSDANKITAKVPSWRADDIEIPGDLIEEVARVYGYFKLPSVIPPISGTHPYNQVQDLFYWEKRVRNALKYWGFTEIYSYPMVDESMLEVAVDEAVTIKNPLTEDHIYMRTTLIPSLLEAIRENKPRDKLMLYELANVYLKKNGKLPDEKLKLAGVIKRPDANFLYVKGLVEALLSDLGIKNVGLKPTKGGGVGADVYIGRDMIGEIEQLEKDLIDFEFDFETILKHANLKKIYIPPSKFPEAQEDLRFEIDPDKIGVDESIAFDKIVKTIKEQSELVKRVELLDVYKNKKTFRIIYQSGNRNLTNEDLTELREKITAALKSKLKAQPA